MDQNNKPLCERSPLFEHPEPKPLMELEQRDIIFSILAVLVSVLTTVFGVFGGFTLAFTASLLCLMTLIAIYFGKKGHKNLFGITCAIIAFPCSLCFFLTSNTGVKFFAFIEVFLLITVFLDGIVKPQQGVGDITFFGQILYSLCSSISNIGISVKSISAVADNNKKSFSKAVIGVICAIPVLIIVVPLLMSSDSAFQGFINNIFSNVFQSLLKVLLGVLLSLFVIAYGFSMKKDKAGTLKPSEFGGIDTTYIISFLSVISVCYLMYLFSQLAYFFSAFSGFLPEGYVFTVAQYARRGFFEMTAISAINILIVFLCVTLSKKKEGKLSVGIKILCSFIIGFTLIIITTAISKMMLYINNFGMTVLRITTSSFMVFLAVVFIALLLRVYIAKVKVLKVALITAGCVLTVLGAVNVNAFSARYNYQKYVDKSLPNIDVSAIYELGDEGVPYLVLLAESRDSEVRSDAKDYLYECYREKYYSEDIPESNFKSEKIEKYRKYKGLDRLSLPKIRAYNALYEYLENNPDFAYYKPTYYFENDLEAGVW